jgi:hypothetical protein
MRANDEMRHGSIPDLVSIGSNEAFDLTVRELRRCIDALVEP